MRRFAALLFWGGGNELFPRRLSPPVALEEIVHREDPGRFYIASSMDGGIKGGNMSEHDDEYALAPRDGPYTMLMPLSFAQRNPGLHANLTISFQPEVGFTSAPSYRGLLRFLSATEAEPIPERGADSARERRATRDAMARILDAVAEHAFDELAAKAAVIWAAGRDALAADAADAALAARVEALVGEGVEDAELDLEGQPSAAASSGVGRRGGAG